MNLKVGDRVKLPHDGRMLKGYIIGGREFNDWDSDGLIIHGNVIPTQEYFDKGGIIIDIKGEFALVRASCTRGVQIPWRLTDITRIKITLKNILEDL